MDNLNKALDAQAKAFETDKITDALEKKHEKLVADAAQKDSDLIDAEIDALTASIETEIEADREKEEDRREELAQEKEKQETERVIYTKDHTVKEMKSEAKLRGIAGYSRMKEAELIKVLNA